MRETLKLRAGLLLSFNTETFCKVWRVKVYSPGLYASLHLIISNNHHLWLSLSSSHQQPAMEMAEPP